MDYCQVQLKYDGLLPGTAEIWWIIARYSRNMMDYCQIQLKLDGLLPGTTETWWYIAGHSWNLMDYCQVQLKFDGLYRLKVFFTRFETCWIIIDRLCNTRSETEYIIDSFFSRSELWSTIDRFMNTALVVQQIWNKAPSDRDRYSAGYKISNM